METKVLLQLIDEMLMRLNRLSEKKANEKEIALILETNKKFAKELEA